MSQDSIALPMTAEDRAAYTAFTSAASAIRRAYEQEAEVLRLQDKAAVDDETIRGLLETKRLNEATMTDLTNALNAALAREAQLRADLTSTADALVTEQRLASDHWNALQSTQDALTHTNEALNSTRSDLTETSSRLEEAEKLIATFRNLLGGVSAPPPAPAPVELPPVEPVSTPAPLDDITELPNPLRGSQRSYLDNADWF